MTAQAQPHNARARMRTVAARFGIAESVVIQRLKIGRLSPALLAANRGGQHRGDVQCRPIAPLRLLSIGRYNHGLGRQAPLPFCEAGSLQPSKTAQCRERTPLVGATTGRIAVHFFYEWTDLR
jgi:hypothetical protein